MGAGPSSYVPHRLCKAVLSIAALCDSKHKISAESSLQFSKIWIQMFLRRLLLACFCGLPNCNAKNIFNLANLDSFIRCLSLSLALMFVCLIIDLLALSRSKTPVAVFSLDFPVSTDLCLSMPSTDLSLWDRQERYIIQITIDQFTVSCNPKRFLLTF